MVKLTAVAWLLFLCACSSTSDLSKVELAKADPAIRRLLSAAEVDEREYTVGVRPSGVKEYEVIIRANSTEELRSAGVRILSTFVDVFTARLTLPEVRRVLNLSSVRSVENGSKNQLH